MWRWSVLVALASLLVACAFDVGPVSPQPNISLPRKHPGFALELKGVPDTYEVPDSAGIEGGQVHGWRGSLTAAFRNAFPSEPADDRLTLALERAEFTVVPAAVTAMGGVVSGRGQIRFRGRWVHGEDEVAFSGTAESKTTTTNRAEIPMLARSAIETMFEQIWGSLAKEARKAHEE